MDFEFSTEYEDFRKELRSFAEKDMPEGFDPSNINQFGKHWVHTYMDKNCLSIPIFYGMKKKEINLVINKINNIIKI